MPHRESRWIVPLDANVEPARAVRGTLLIVSREQLRTHALFDHYTRILSEDVERQLEAVVAGDWVPMELAHAHFAAVDAMNLDDDTILASTTPTAEKLHGVFIATAIQLLRTTVFTPWTALPVGPKMWSRVFQGGSVGAEEIGPKDAHVVFVGNPLVRHRYHRLGLRTHVEFFMNIIATCATVREVSCDPDRGMLTLLVRWV